MKPWILKWNFNVKKIYVKNKKQVKENKSKQSCWNQKYDFCLSECYFVNSMVDRAF